jgi:predicted nucleotidyltransferase
MKAAITDLRPVLEAYAKEHRGRFVVFGSAARDQLRFDSDLDILLDFPPDEELAAWLFAEQECWSRRLTPDLHLKSWSAPEFLKRIGALQ